VRTPTGVSSRNTSGPARSLIHSNQTRSQINKESTVMHDPFQSYATFGSQLSNPIGLPFQAYNPQYQFQGGLPQMAMQSPFAAHAGIQNPLLAYLGAQSGIQNPQLAYLAAQGGIQNPALAYLAAQGGIQNPLLASIALQNPAVLSLLSS